jgi:uncharacterized protein
MFGYPTAGAARIGLLGLGLILGLVLSTSTAGAQQPSATAIATAKELVTVKGAKTLYEPLVAGVIEKAKGMFLQTNPMLGKDLNEVAAKLRADLAPRSAEVLTDTARLYATRFTEQELKDTLAFYKSPLGRKLLAEEPIIADQSMKSATSWAEKFSEEVISKMRTEMRKRGHDI